MDLDLLTVTALIVLGASTGFLAGLLGIGGVMSMVPFMTMLFSPKGVEVDLVVKVAIATSLATILFTSLSSARAHFKKGAVDMTILKPMGLGALLGTFLGANFAGMLKGTVLAAVFAAFVGYSALSMLRGKKPKPGRETPSTRGLGLVGSGIGFISALLGAGGWFITVPFLTWCNVKLHTAVGVSAGMGFPIALGGLTGYIISGWNVTGLPGGSIGYIYLPALIILVVGSMLTAPFGAKVAHTLNVDSLRKFFAYFLFLLAAYMFTKAF